VLVSLWPVQASDAESVGHSTVFVFVLDGTSSEVPEGPRAFKPSTSIRTDGKYILPSASSGLLHTPMHAATPITVPINTDNAVVMRALIESWVRKICPDAGLCATFGFAVPGFVQLSQMPCELFNPVACPLHQCARLGILGCKSRRTCAPMNTRKSCIISGWCNWSPDTPTKCSSKS
jgi:hypothetical protein